MVSTDRQLSKPAAWIAPIPSQRVKLRNSTPANGTTAKAMKNSSAGSAIQATDPLRPPVRGGLRRRRAATGGASAVTGR